MNAVDVIPRDCPVRVTSADIASWCGVSVQTVHRWAASGVIPQPIRFGPKVVRWDREELRKAFKNARLLIPQAGREEARQESEHSSDLKCEVVIEDGPSARPADQVHGQ